ncbi:AraC family transcriptional regulator [Nocardia inohanensis]|uniref:AraC family transcriptional regulator n=1 Tax=Nocardia inohanensis TaxID=209246 RepID=UPI00082AC983|nr:AraC family transcriptional regulator [Nocardia inohanensis]
MATISPVVIAAVVGLARQRGLDPNPWFAGTGLTPDHMVLPETRVSFCQSVSILRRAVRTMPEGPLGMHVGTRDVLLSCGLPGVAMRFSRTVADAVRVGREFQNLVGVLIDSELETHGDQVALRLIERMPEPELLRFLCEEAFCSSLLMLKAMTGMPVAPVELHLAYPAPPYADLYAKFFGCPVRFNADANRMFFPAAILNERTPFYDETSLRGAVLACRELMKEDDVRPDIVAAVETILRENVRNSLTMTDVARRLNVTERTLRRMLAAAGEQFSNIRDRVRRQRAEFLISKSNMKIATIADEIGYSDIRDFRRAYVRWTGHPPTQTRRRAAAHHLPRVLPEL